MSDHASPTQAINHCAAIADNVAVTAFSEVMKNKLAISRDKGRGGWQECSTADLWEMLRHHVEKGDPVDVANLAMMIWHVTYSWGAKA